MKIYISILCAFLFLGINAQDISQKELKSTLNFLASDALKGRKILTPENEITVEYIASRFENLGLKPCIGNSYKVPFQYEGSTADNVCAAKPGKTDEIIIVSAHFDHIGVKEDSTATGDIIFNGADDNASGVAAVIGIAEYLKKKKTNKTVWFVGFNAEEVGLVGSKEFVKNPGLDLKKVAAVFNFEMLGTVSEFGKNTVFMTGDDRSDFDEIINKLKIKNLEVKADPYKQYNLFERSDNAPFAKQGVIAHSFSTVDLKTTHHYHQVDDEVEVFDFENYTNIVNGLAKAVEKFAKKKLQPEYSK